MNDNNNNVTVQFDHCKYQEIIFNLESIQIKIILISFPFGIVLSQAAQEVPYKAAAQDACMVV
jgi:hypothetical protein